jgi:hypothetical protein
MAIYFSRALLESMKILYILSGLVLITSAATWVYFKYNNAITSSRWDGQIQAAGYWLHPYNTNVSRISLLELHEGKTKQLTSTEKDERLLYYSDKNNNETYTLIPNRANSKGLNVGQIMIDPNDSNSAKIIPKDSSYAEAFEYLRTADVEFRLKIITILNYPEIQDQFIQELVIVL